MATNLALDDNLIEEARELGGLRTKKEVVTQALLEYVQRRKQRKLLELFGTVDYDPDFDVTAQRRLARPSQAPL
jgi:Arc/MetJ family transcription regulator